jgi:hypothetical protein
VVVIEPLRTYMTHEAYNDEADEIDSIWIVTMRVASVADKWILNGCVVDAITDVVTYGCPFDTSMAGSGTAAAHTPTSTNNAATTRPRDMFIRDTEQTKR